MAFFSELAKHVEVLRGVLGEDVAADALPGAIIQLDDAVVVAVITAASGIMRAAENVRIAASGVAASRSTPDAGHGGLAQVRGHRSPVALIQDLTGTTHADAAKQVRLGESLLAAAGVGASGEGVDDVADGGDRAVPLAIEPWHAPLGRALLGGVISSAQHDAILRGLGVPPVLWVAGGDVDADADADAQGARDMAEVWSLAAEHLAAEAAQRTVEELARAARTVRDQLDPDGAQRRFEERFERRSFRTWTDADGIRRGSIAFEDLGGAWMQSILDSALRPRRGGPRFVDSAEKAAAEQLVADPRTNDQLSYDLLLDVLRAGSLADPTAVFGTRQAGVRVLVTADDLAAGVAGGAADRAAIGLIEEGLTAIPATFIAQQACDTGAVRCTIDREGNPLYLGREQRLFSTKQRLVLAVRDGGCRWKGCDRPPSYCEAHHIDHFGADEGRTDVDRGILLCRYHHMELHHGGWKITRDRLEDFILHPPPGRGKPIALVPRLALQYAWAGIDPPPKRFRPAA